MKIILAQPMGYLFSIGGAHKANRVLMEGLAERGHYCRALSPRNFMGSLSAFAEEGKLEDLREQLAERGIYLTSSAEGDAFQLNGVDVRLPVDYVAMCAQFREHVREVDPTWILVSEDTAHLIVAAALEASPSRVVYVSHSPSSLPFGPGCFSPDPAKEELLGRAAAIITVSDYMRGYIKRWSGLESVVLRFPVYGPGPYPDFGRFDFDNGFVTMINPCAIKGISILLELARRFPQIRFASVVTWGTVKSELKALEELPNMTILQPSENMDEVLGQTRVLLAPSLWGEAFGQVVIDAMLRGIPVLASDSGGLPEAKLGVDYVLPVKQVERYEEFRNEKSQLDHVPVIPQQDIEPWDAALRQLVSNRDRYERVSRQSRDAALEFVSRLSIDTFENFLGNLAATERVNGEQARSDKRKPHADKVDGFVGSLLPGHRALLRERLRARLIEAISERRT